MDRRKGSVDPIVDGLDEQVDLIAAPLEKPRRGAPDGLRQPQRGKGVHQSVWAFCDKQPYKSEYDRGAEWPKNIGKLANPVRGGFRQFLPCREKHPFPYTVRTKEETKKTRNKIHNIQSDFTLLSAFLQLPAGTVQIFLGTAVLKISTSVMKSNTTSNSYPPPFRPQV